MVRIDGVRPPEAPLSNRCRDGYVCPGEPVVFQHKAPTCGLVSGHVVVVRVVYQPAQWVHWVLILLTRVSRRGLEGPGAVAVERPIDVGCERADVEPASVDVAVFSERDVAARSLPAISKLEKPVVDLARVAHRVGEGVAYEHGRVVCLRLVYPRLAVCVVVAVRPELLG